MFAHRIFFIAFFSLILFCILAASLNQFSIGQLLSASLSAAQLLGIIYLSLMIFLIYMGIVYYKFRYVVRRDRLQIILFPFALSIYYDTIYEIDLKPSRGIECPPGWGLRIWGRSLFATTGREQCLYIRRLEGFLKEFYLSSADPENLVLKIKNNMRKYFAPRKT
ncbi:MAG: hypothetical protein QXV37_02270 [Candidatus Jordarchaeaceae archaeon]